MSEKLFHSPECCPVFTPDSFFLSKVLSSSKGSRPESIEGPSMTNGGEVQGYKPIRADQAGVPFCHFEWKEK